MPTRLHWRYEERRIPVVIGAGTVELLPRFVRAMAPDRAFVLAPANLEKFHGDRIRKVLKEARWVRVGEGEAAKTMTEAERICSRLVAAGATRESILIAAGGGVTGDLAGFIASILYRGIRYVQLPSTLLAMIDSSIGAKTGVNIGAKNVAGAFYPPEAVLADVRFLRTLPPLQLDAAIFEAFKMALIEGGLFYRRFTRRAAHLDRSSMTRLIADCVAAKIRIVEHDPREADLRRVLNLGHTLGHVYEVSAGLPHGFAVGWGLVAAVLISLRMGLLEAAEAARILEVMEALPELPRLPSIASPEFRLLRADKKRGGAGLRFVALRGVGKPEVVTLDEAPSVLRAVTRELAGVSLRHIRERLR